MCIALCVRDSIHLMQARAPKTAINIMSFKICWPWKPPLACILPDKNGPRLTVQLFNCSAMAVQILKCFGGTQMVDASFTFPGGTDRLNKAKAYRHGQETTQLHKKMQAKTCLKTKRTKDDVTRVQQYQTLAPETKHARHKRKLA